jgi:hypothetical protein
MSKVFNRDVRVAGELQARAVVVEGALVVETVADTNGATLAPQIGATGTVSAQAATATLTTAIAGKIVTNTGAAGAVVYTLPSASSMSGKTFKVKVLVAQTVTLTPATGEAIFLAGSGVVSKNLIIAGVIGNEVTVYSNGTSYEAYYPNGVVTKQA